MKRGGADHQNILERAIGIGKLHGMVDKERGRELHLVVRREGEGNVRDARIAELKFMGRMEIYR